MPIIKSAKKAARQAEKRTAHNVQIKKTIKAALKAFKANPTPETMAKAQSEYDKAAKKGLIKKNTASRRKAALAKIAKAAGSKPAKTSKNVVKNTTTSKKNVVKSTTSAKTTEKKAAAKTPKAKAPAAKK